MSQTLQALEQTIETLLFSEKLWLLKRIVHLLRASHAVDRSDPWANALAEMAADPDIQAESTRISNEFITTETDR